jgi:hypothetical protein
LEQTFVLIFLIHLTSVLEVCLLSSSREHTFPNNLALKATSFIVIRSDITTFRTMRSVLFVLLAAMLTFVAAIPITPSAPRFQKRAEQFRLQGLREVSTNFT